MSSSSPSPTSDETPSERETQNLRDFVNEVTAIDRQASMSPRSAVLSHSSLRTGPLSNHLVDPSSAIVDTRAQPRKRSKRRQQSQALEIARPSALSQLVDVDISRKNPIDEVMRLRQILKTVEKHAVLETQRATDLQRANQEAQHRVQLLNETKLIAEQEAAKANQEKRLYQFQLDSAQKEIERSQEAVKRAERQREEAEADAARARAKARKLHEQKLVLAAREEGRRLGFEAGFEHARTERQINASRKNPNVLKSALKPIPIEVIPSTRTDKGKGKERAYPEDGGSIYPDHRSINRPQNASTRHSMRERDDIISSPDSPEMSPSQLKLINLPPVDIVSRPPSMQAGPSNSSPLRPFRPPTATHSEASERGMPSQNFQPFPQPQQPQPQRQPQPPIQIQPQPQPSYQQSSHPPSHVPVQSASPEMDRWSINVPSASQLNLQRPVVTIPRDQWVTAEKHLETRSPPPQFPGGPPPLHIPPRQPPPLKAQANPTHAKAVKFPLLSRPSLLKTKQQAASWYRSLSLRKKNKPVIDPEEPPTSAPTSAPLNTASTMNSQPQSGTEPPTTAESAAMYGQQPQPAMSWYQAKQPSVPAAPSMRSQYSKRRPTSDMMSVSTRVSQFDLLSTPYIAAQSVRSGKEDNRRVKEKDSYLSAIKENPLSRETTPSADRYLPAGSIPGAQMGPNGSYVTQPNFGQPSLNQRSSYATFESSNKRNSRRPPPSSIAIPDPDDALEPAGAAYARHIRSISGGQQNYSGADLARRPSRISERTTPDTSIVIDVVPPSGFAPDAPRSPPHTGVNHLSPYHTFQPPSQASPRVARMQSVTSLRTHGGTRVEPPADGAGSVADSRRKSRQSLNTYTDPTQTSYFQPRPPSTSSRTPSRFNNDQYYQEPTQPYTPQPQAYQQPQGRAESVRSSASRPQPSHPMPMTSQASLAMPNANPQDMNSSGQYLDRPNIQRMKSSTSLRSVISSYSKYKPEEYVDPAFWSAEGPGELMQPQGGGGSIYRGRVPSRPASVNSGISYV